MSLYNSHRHLHHSASLSFSLSSHHLSAYTLRLTLLLTLRLFLTATSPVLLHVACISMSLSSCFTDYHYHYPVICATVHHLQYSTVQYTTLLLQCVMITTLSFLSLYHHSHLCLVICVAICRFLYHLLYHSASLLPCHLCNHVLPLTAYLTHYSVICLCVRQSHYLVIGVTESYSPHHHLFHSMPLSVPRHLCACVTLATLPSVSLIVTLATPSSASLSFLLPWRPRFHYPLISHSISFSLATRYVATYLSS